MQLMGRVKFWNLQKKWGFIRAENNQEIFVHWTGLSGDGFKRLNKGDIVKFETEQHPRGIRAVNVEVMK